VVKCLRWKNWEVYNSLHKSPSFYPNLRQCTHSNPFPKVRRNALLLFAAYPGGGPPNGPRLPGYKMLWISHSDIPHASYACFRILYRQFPTYVRVPFLKFFLLNPKFTSVRIDPPPPPTYLSQLFGYVCPFTSVYMLRMQFISVFMWNSELHLIMTVLLLLLLLLLLQLLLPPLLIIYILFLLMINKNFL